MTLPPEFTTAPALDDGSAGTAHDVVVATTGQQREGASAIAELRSRIATLAGECGCTMGGIFFSAALAVTVVYFLIAGGLGLDSGLLAVGFVFVASVVGKLVGLGVARIRMFRMRRLLAAQLAGVEEGHVHLH